MQKGALSNWSNFPKYLQQDNQHNPSVIGHVVGERSPPQLGKCAYLGAVEFVAIAGALRPQGRCTLPILERPARRPVDADPRRYRSAGDAAVAAAAQLG